MTKRYNTERIVKIIAEKKSGISIHDICDKYAISESTFYRWQSEYSNKIQEQMHSYSIKKPLEELIADIRLEVDVLKRQLTEHGINI